MRPMPIVGALASAVLLAGASAASAAVVTTQDERGRKITIDARPSQVDIGAYARLLRNSVHGDEIETVTLRLVPAAAVGVLCGSQRARACYRDGRQDAVIIAREGSVAENAYTILHEYGHHVDASIPHNKAPELNGTPRWWGTRAIGRRLARGQVATGYSLGWSRSIGEIFAEDYAQLHIRGPYAIRWLPRPEETEFRAIRLDITGRATGPPPRPGAVGVGEPIDPPGTALSRGLRRAAKRAAR